ncbi:Forkhead box protein J1-B [Larimichthys crocea]|uniref:Forkhead box protein J1-B n=1 Tax=Larimichthys crocea TaxID=215358 RepID=A0A6G0HZH0_LARCR|nr:Forkhead box protein J1-B [Larimichthys crocea]
MPVLTSPDIANKFKEKWLAVYPEDQVTGSDSAPMDDSLTSLHWLQNFSILSADPERPNGLDRAVHPLSTNSFSSVSASPEVAPTLRQAPSRGHRRDWDAYILREPCHLRQRLHRSATVCQLRTSWERNSIRHNLSLNKCFKKEDVCEPLQQQQQQWWQQHPQTDKLVQGYHSTQNGFPYQGVGVKRKHLPSKNNGKAMRASESPLLATEAHKADILRGDFDLASVFDDVLSGSCSTFEDLDINTALSSLGCEMEVSMQGRQHSAGLGRWCGGGDIIGQTST